MCRGGKGSGFGGRLSRGRRLQENPDLPIGADPQGESPLTGVLESRRRVLPGQGQESQTASIGLLGMTAGGQERLHHLAGGDPDPVGPLQEAFRAPAAYGLVRLGHVCGEGRVATRSKIFSVTGHPFPVMEDLHDGLGDADPDLLVDQGMGDGVKVAIDLDVVVDMDPRFLPPGQLVAGGRKRTECRLLPGEEEILSGSGATVLERAGVDFLEKDPDRPVQLGEVEEGPLAKLGQDPAGHQEDRLFGGSLVPGTSDARRKDRHGVVFRHLPVGLVGERLVKIGRRDPALEVIGDQEGGNAFQEREAADMGTDPAGQLLARRRLGKDIVREPQDGDEDLGVQRHASCFGIPDRDGGPGIVEEEPVSRGIGVPEGRLQTLFIGGVVNAEAGVAISPLLACLPVLFPEEQEGDALVALE